MTPTDWPAFTADETDLEKLVKLSRFYGSDPQFVLAGGGNTSMKTDEVLHVKASGHALGTIGPEGFVALERKQLTDLLAADLGDDAADREARFTAGMMDARLDPSNPARPSVESALHNLVPGRFVVHTHSTLVNAITCCRRGRELAGELFGDRVLWVEFVEPGYKLARAIRDALAEYEQQTGRAFPDAVLLANHGVFISGDSPEEIRTRTDELLSAIRDAVEPNRPSKPFGEVCCMADANARAMSDTLGPARRGLLAEGTRLKVVRFDDSAVATQLACGARLTEFAEVGGLTPDQIVYAGPWPMVYEPDASVSPVDQVARLREAIKAHKSAHAGTPPQVILAKGLGLFAAGDDVAGAETVRAVFSNAMEVMALAEGIGGVRAMGPEHRAFIEGWEAEAYRSRLVKATAAGGRAAGKIALVTGAAQGFGREIADDLAAEGACVVLADINADGVAAAADELADQAGAHRALGVAMNVTDAGSIADALHRAIRAYGGLDVLVSNAGVLKAGSVKDLPERDFDFVTAVNYKGYFLCVRQVAPIYAVQHAACPDAFFDVLQINSKSGLVGSNRNGAYAGGKFGGIGLTQSFALELIEDRVKVNSICPGNFFEGPLWSDPQTGLFVQYLQTGKVPGARTVEDVKRAYETKVPMGRGCRTADVMKAVYYCLEQTYETGQAIPVTGGQVMLK